MDQNKDSRADDTSSPDEERSSESKPSPSGSAAGGGDQGGSIADQQGSGAEQPHSVMWYAGWATIISIPVGVITAIAIAVFGGGSDISISANSSRNPRLERVDLIVHNSIPSRQPGLELLVRNGGSGRSVISRAQLEIRRVYSLPLCYAQGDLSLSGRYGVELSPASEPGEIIEVPVHQQLGGNGADRFRIDLETRPRVEGGLVQTLYLFEVAVALVHDGKKDPLRMGTALISLPAVPLSEFLLEQGQFKKAIDYFSPGLSGRELREEWSQRLACWQANGREAARARKSRATRSQDLEEALASAAVPSFAEREG
jgi:hypothetical protein